MTKIDSNLIKMEIERQNPWHRDNSVLAEDPNKPHRNIYPEIKNRILNSPLITAVTGLRRIGKTTIVKQVINDLLVKGTEKNRIIYFSFEEFTLFKTPNLLTEIIEFQVKNIVDGPIYFFLDEIQYVDFWNAILKKYADLLPRLKFTVIGSSSLFIKTKALESLAGRIQETVMKPLGFSEYLRINKKIEIPKPLLLKTEGLKSYTEQLTFNFNDYLAFGEFPFLPNLPEWEEKREYVLSLVIGKILEQDLPKLQRIVRAEEMITLGNVLIEGSSQLVELRNLAADLGISRTTLSAYLMLLEKSNIVAELFNKGSGFRTRSTRQRKIYSQSVNAVVMKNTLGPGSESFFLKAGQIIETFVYNYLRNNSTNDIFLWRHKQVHEVDFLIVNPEGILPLEVKYQPQIRPGDLKSLVYFCQKQKLKRAVVVTKDKEGEETAASDIKIQFIPAYYLV